MAIVTQKSTGTTWSDPERIAALLAPHGVLYERWGVEQLASTPRPEGVSVEDHILSVFAPEIERISKARGYQTADVIALTPETPNLDAICAKFDRHHFHTEDEVRFVVHGRGMFAVRGEDGDFYEVEVHPGDLLAVPEKMEHYFELCEDRTIQCIRLFTDMAGWVAHYTDEAASSGG